jgi:hypothetical protein
VVTRELYMRKATCLKILLDGLYVPAEKIALNSAADRGMVVAPNPRS